MPKFPYVYAKNLSITSLIKLQKQKKKKNQFSFLAIIYTKRNFK